MNAVDPFTGELDDQIERIADIIRVVAEPSDQLVHTFPPFKIIISQPADQRVRTFSSIKIIIPQPADQHVSACFAQENVGTVIAIEQIVAIVSDKIVVSGLAEKHVCTEPSIEPIRTVTAEERVVAAFSVETIVPLVALDGVGEIVAEAAHGYTGQAQVLDLGGTEKYSRASETIVSVPPPMSST
jgi:hypothetical protein